MKENSSRLPAIVTPRLVLRERSPSDADALLPAMSDHLTMRWWSGPPFATMEALRTYLSQDGGDWRAWAIPRPGDDRALGFISAGERRPGVSEIGYLVVPEAQGFGFASEAVSGLVTRLFVDGHRRVFADTDPDNRPSVALLERLGFQLEGRLRDEWETHIGVRDSLIYGLLADEWQPASICGGSVGADCRGT